MILVLLTRFSDSRESIVGFSLCQKLAEQGYNLYVTTTSTGEVLQREIQKAADISTRAKGSVTLVQPQSNENKEPKAEWIVTHHEKYFGFLSEPNDIQAVIGLLPGTEEAAVELKEALDCKLVLLACTEISQEVYKSKYNDLDRVAQIADEIWIFGSDIFRVYNSFFKKSDKSLCEKLKQLSLQPFLEKFINKRIYSVYESRTNGAKIISGWRSSHTSFAFRKEEHTNGSDTQSFVSLCSAFEELNCKTNSNKIQWQIYGMSSEDRITFDKHARAEKLNSSLFTEISSHTDFSWDECSAFIAPDKEADFNFDALTAVLYGIPILVSSESAIGHFLQQLKCPQKTKALVNLTGDVENDKEIWTNTICKRILDEGSNPMQWAKKIRKEIKKSFQAWRKSILVLLHKFNEAQEFCLGFQLCHKLVKEGHHLLVSTTASRDELDSEKEKAKLLTDNSPGSVTLIEPHCGEQEVPSIEWIEHSSSKYFWHLSQLQNVQMVIGNLPGTSETAVKLKEELKCRLILLATTKLGSDNDVLKSEICTLAEKADEIWSVGSDTYKHYNDIFLEKDIGSAEKHRKILFQPCTKCIPSWKQNSTDHKIRQKLFSSWNKPVHFFLKGKKKGSVGGSDDTSFSTLDAALRNVMPSDLRRDGPKQWQWHIHGIKHVDSRLTFAASHATLDITPLDEVASADDIDWDNCLAFMVPDREEETFNYLALTAIWLGIPTLAASQSSIGKFLRNLERSYPDASRGVVNLTGNTRTDTEEWTSQIKEVLSEDAKPIEWAKKLALYIQNNKDLWELHLPTFKNNSKRLLSSSLNASLFTKKDGKIIRSDVLDEVTKKRPNVPENNVESKHSGKSSFGSQVCSVLL